MNANKFTNFNKLPQFCWETAQQFCLNGSRRLLDFWGKVSMHCNRGYMSHEQKTSHLTCNERLDKTYQRWDAIGQKVWKCSKTTSMKFLHVINTNSIMHPLLYTRSLPIEFMACERLSSTHVRFIKGSIPRVACETRIKFHMTQKHR